MSIIAEHLCSLDKACEISGGLRWLNIGGSIRETIHHRISLSYQSASLLSVAPSDEGPSKHDLQASQFPDGVSNEMRYGSSVDARASIATTSSLTAAHDEPYVPYVPLGLPHCRVVTRPRGDEREYTPSGKGTLSISIDFGATFSGVAYASSRIANGRVQQILTWPGAIEASRKIPTCLLYDNAGRLLAWGLEAKYARRIPGTVRCEWFKLFLEPSALRDGVVDPRLPKLPLGKKAVDLIIDFLTCLWDVSHLCSYI